MDHFPGVAEVMDSSRRWDGYVCPSCRRVFRVASDYDGRGVVCPACNGMLRLPVEGEELPPLVITDAHQNRKKRRKSKRRSDEQWESSASDQPDKMIMRLLVASMVSIVVVVVAALLWPRGDQESIADNNSGSGMAFPETESTIATDGEDSSGAGQSSAQEITTAFLESEIRPVAEGFMEAESIDEAARWVHDAATARPRMEEYYAGGFEKMGMNRLNTKDFLTSEEGWVLVQAENNNFEPMYMFFVEGDDGWKLDWESLIGWSDMSLQELKEQKPTEPVEMRVMLQADDYYNFDFIDEERWACFSLSTYDEDERVYAYVPRGSEIFFVLKANEEQQERRMILKIRYPEDATSDNQVLVDEIVSDKWIKFED